MLDGCTSEVKGVASIEGFVDELGENKALYECTSEVKGVTSVG